MNNVTALKRKPSRALGLLALLASCGIALSPTDSRQASGTEQTGKAPLASVQDMIAARTDVWGEAAMRQPDGASYEFFKDLLPPVRYVNTAFRHYPIMLSAPLSSQKARLVSNGSAINALANKKPMWREIGVPVTFRVGDPATTFGQNLESLDGPRYANGYLPVVQMTYRHNGVAYEEEVFAPVEPELAEHGTLLVRFTPKASSRARVAAHVAAAGALEASGVSIRNSKGHALVTYDSSWRWEASGKQLVTAFSPQRSALLAVYTRPTSQPISALTMETYEYLRQQCLTAWNDLLARGMQLEVPEQIVNNAWRSLVIGNFMIAVGDRMHYSAGNAYDHLYEGECGDATRSLLYFGFAAEARRMVGPLLDFQRKDTRFHVAGHKLQLLCDYYWMTRDREYLREKEPVWRSVVEFIMGSSDPATSLVGRDRYAGDISQQVFSLKSNSNCWRGLRDISTALDDMGEHADAQRIAQRARQLREAILDAVAKSERLDTRPPFIPNALLSDEEPHDPLTATRMGSYYNLIAPYTLGSGIFGYNSPREQWLLEYLQQRGGIAMGMIRCQPHQGEFDKQPGINVLYGLRYQQTLMRRDDRERALVGFYGHLAQAMTRDTFIGAEGSRFLHGDKYGRSMYLPPNSANNAMFLLTLRRLLIQDWDLNEDNKPETLRLLYAIPRRWLGDGAVLKIERAPTAFGTISLDVSSRLTASKVTVRIVAPPLSPQTMSLRLPLPSGWK
ncbi:hypothetical protein FJY63_08830, partial [Candidatus Sumerlaeota bacterium]|nr:hypothetical protein [Candidatus Sumerlaeota bacterium]